jgi:hypothetical protein
LRERVLKADAACRVPVGSSHAAINAKPSAIWRSCTTALHVRNLAHVCGGAVSTNVPSFVEKTVALA